jgi:hypothetical protein
MNDLRKKRIHIFDSMCFIDDNIFEAEYLEGDFLDESNFVTRDANFEILRNEPVFVMISARSSSVPARMTVHCLNSHSQF